MLRGLFVLIIIAVGSFYALQAPFYALLLYVWNAYFRPEAWAWGATSSLLLRFQFSYCVGIFLVGYTLISKQRFHFSGQALLLFVMLGHALISSLLAEYPQYVWPYFIDFLKGIIITYLITVLANDRRKLYLLLLVMCLSLGLEATKQGCIQLLINPGGRNDNEIPFLGDNNGVAVGMLMLAPLVASVRNMTTSKWAKRFLGIMFVGIIYRALSTYSRGGFLSFLAFAGVYWLRSQQKLRSLLGFVVVAAIVLPVLPEQFWSRMETIQTYEEVGDDSAISRLHLWKVGALMGAKNPVFGVGFNGYNFSFDAYDFLDGRFGRGRSVHSSWFGVIAELGYVGMGFYLLNLLLAWRNCRFASRVARQDPRLEDIRQFSSAIEASLVVFCVGGTFLPFQYNEMFFHIVGCSMVLRALATQAQNQDEARSEEARQRQTAESLA